MTFYRLHSNDDAPCFCAEHAYSGLWGRTWTEDGSQTECWCEGDDDCRDCDGTGWQDAQHGYSCLDSAAELVDYMTKHGVVTDNDPVVVFEGREVGTGFDGEPLAVPTGEVQWITWSDLRRLAEREYV